MLVKWLVSKNIVILIHSHLYILMFSSGINIVNGWLRNLLGIEAEWNCITISIGRVICFTVK